MSLLAREAWSCGYADAMRGTFYQASAPAGSEIKNNWLNEYTDGWNIGREHRAKHGGSRNES